MINRTGREAASDHAAFGAKTAIVNRKGSDDLAERDSARAIARLCKRAESRVEKELDAFWENVPI
jgi:hypothetical protein